MLRRAIIMRPYSLEREFGRMRVCLNNYLAHEVASRLNSVGIASEFITEPELRESLQTREAFISTFRHDVADLNTLFVQLLETAEQIAMPNRVARSPVDLRALIEDLAAKIQGLASERSADLTCDAPPAPALHLGRLPLALPRAVRRADARAARRPRAHRGHPRGARRRRRGRDGDRRRAAGDEADAAPWPPPALFPLDDAHPRIGRLAIGDLAVTRAIFLLHAGELRVARLADRTEYTVTLPA